MFPIQKPPDFVAASIAPRVAKFCGALDPTESFRIPLKDFQTLALSEKLKVDRSISFTNLDSYLDQAKYDPSVAHQLQRGLRVKVEAYLHIQSTKYEYASLLGQLVREWQSTSIRPPDFINDFVTSALKQKLTAKLGITDIPDGFLYFPVSMGGLGLKNPFIELQLVQKTVVQKPDDILMLFTSAETAVWREAKAKWDAGNTHMFSNISNKTKDELNLRKFMGISEFVQYSEQTSHELYKAYMKLLKKPSASKISLTPDLAVALVQRPGLPTGSSLLTPLVQDLNDGVAAWKDVSPYDRYVVQLYGPEMIKKFGDLVVVEKGLLPMGLLSMLQESRFKWQA